MTYLSQLTRTLGEWFRADEVHATLLPGRLGRGGTDKLLVLATFGLVVLGLGMVYSATTLKGARPSVYLEQQAFKVFLGVIAFALGLKIDYHHWSRWAPVYYLLGLVVMALVFVPGIGHSAGGASRWINLFGFTLQPSDFARISLVIYLAYLLSKPRPRLERFSSGTLPCLIAVGLVCLMLLMQPDLSTAVSFVTIAGLMLVAGRTPWRHFLVVGAPAVLVALFGIRDYQLKRFLSWPDYWLHGTGRLDVNYQLDQSILAIGSGGIFGRGLGESRQKWDYLPDAHTDFIFAIIGEELGFVGSVVVIGLLGLLLWRAFEAARRAPDRFGTLLAIGIGSGVAVYASVNMMVATGLMPTTGLPLPLVSYGGSAVLAILFSLGILGNIAAQGDSTLLAAIGETQE